MIETLDIATLYEEHGQSLRGYVVRLVPGYEVAHAEDVVQETFIHAIKHIRSGKPVDPPLGFLCTIARNLVTSMFYRGRKNIATDSMPDMDEYDISTQSPRRLLETNELLQVFLDASEFVHPKYFEAFARKKIYGQSAVEISEAMDIGQNVAFNYVSLGWGQLKEYFEYKGIHFIDYVGE